ncbi:hypothetical protein [Hyphomicrobium sulfonivorans]|nr:hypothetical protein [Hyphomicrobium sulfonivorans]
MLALRALGTVRTVRSACGILIVRALAADKLACGALFVASGTPPLVAVALAPLAALFIARAGLRTSVALVAPFPLRCAGCTLPADKLACGALFIAEAAPAFVTPVVPAFSALFIPLAGLGTPVALITPLPFRGTGSALPADELASRPLFIASAVAALVAPVVRPLTAIFIPLAATACAIRAGTLAGWLAAWRLGEVRAFALAAGLSPSGGFAGARAP